MKNPRKLSATAFLALALAVSAFAGETPTPPCAAPGEIDTPPFAAAPGDPNTSEVTSTAPGDMGGPTLANNDTSLGDIATAALLNFLSLY
jgi:hypothetical protein